MLGLSATGGDTRPKPVDPGPITLFGFLHGLASIAFLSQGVDVGTHHETAAIARSLAQLGSFANPFQPLQTGPTAHLPPLYPAILAVLMRLFGDGLPFRMSLCFLVALAFGGMLAMLPSLTAEVFGDPHIGKRAAWAAILLPIFEMLPGWDATLDATALVAFCLFSCRTGKPSKTDSGIIGLLLGGIALLNPACLLFCVAWLTGIVLLRRRPVMLSLVAPLALVSLVCVPWMWRNHEKIGSWNIRDNFGLELWLSNNDEADASMDFNGDSFSHWSPNWNVEVARTVKDNGEQAVYSRYFRLAATWIRDHPGPFLSLTTRRCLLFWFPDYRRHFPFFVLIWGVTALSLPSIASEIFRLRRPLPLLLLASAAAYSTLYYLVHATLRYRIPILWISLLFASVTVWNCSLAIRRIAAIRSVRPPSGVIREDNSRGCSVTSAAPRPAN